MIMRYFILFLFILLPFNLMAETDNKMLGMIDFIVENSNGKYEYNDEPLPELKRKKMNDICKAIYTPETYLQIKDDCNAVGYYDHDLNIIFISWSSGKYMIDKNFIEVVLLHELVHYIQYVNGEEDKVQCMQQLEEDAYTIQNKYIDHMGYDERQKPNPMFQLFVSMCDNLM